jgi:hypothetical protein
MHEQTIDHNALLLQVMAHDLLAPLTAIKWQLELLAREGSSPKGVEYVRSLQQSSDLGITLTKHAHVAGRVLVGSYQADPIEQSLSTVVESSVRALVPQYERHGVQLDVSVEREENLRSFDTELVAVFVWSIAKFFLSCAPAKAQVLVRGMAVPDTSANTYVLIVSANDIPEADACVESFKKGTARGAYDHAFVFARLIHEVADLLGVDVSAETQGSSLILEAAFRGATAKASS